MSNEEPNAMSDRAEEEYLIEHIALALEARKVCRLREVVRAVLRMSDLHETSEHSRRIRNFMLKRSGITSPTEPQN